LDTVPGSRRASQPRLGYRESLRGDYPVGPDGLDGKMVDQFEECDPAQFLRRSRE